MFWKLSPPPQLSDRRTIVRFAWMPIRCQDGHYYWLKKVMHHQVFQAEKDASFGYVEAWFTVRCEPVLLKGQSENALTEAKPSMSRILLRKIHRIKWLFLPARPASKESPFHSSALGI